MLLRLAMGMLPVAALAVLSCSLDGLTGGAATSSSAATSTSTSASASASSSSTGGLGPEELFDWVSTYGNENKQTADDGMPHLRIARAPTHLVVAADLVGPIAIGTTTVGQDAIRNVAFWDLTPGAGGATTSFAHDLSGNAIEKRIGGLSVADDGRIAIIGYFGKGTLDLAPGVTVENTKAQSQSFVAVYDEGGTFVTGWVLGSKSPSGPQTTTRGLGIAWSGTHLLVTGDYEGNLTVTNPVLDPLGDQASTIEGDQTIPPSKDVFVASLDPSQAPCTWLSEFGSKTGDAQNDTAFSVTQVGDFVVVGGSFNGTFSLGQGLFSAASLGGFVVTLQASTGVVAHGLALANTTVGQTRVTASLPDGRGAIYATGFYEQAVSIADGGNGMACALEKPLTTTGQGTRAGFIAHLTIDDSGSLLCTRARSITGRGPAEARSLLAQDGQIFVSGFTQIPIELDDMSLSCAYGEEDAFVMSFSPDLDAGPNGLSFGSPSAEAADPLAAGFTPGTLLVGGSYGAAFAELPAPRDADFFVGALPWPASLSCH